MLVTKNNIERFIPQRKPLVMIHELHQADENQAVTTFKVEPGNIFLEAGQMTEAGLVENIAQTAAAQVGYVCFLQAKPVPIGYIAAIKDLVLYTLPELGTQVRTVVEVINMVMDITLIKGTVYQKSTVLCECEMRIFINN